MSAVLASALLNAVVGLGLMYFAHRNNRTAKGLRAAIRDLKEITAALNERAVAYVDVRPLLYDGPPDDFDEWAADQ